MLVSGAWSLGRCRSQVLLTREGNAVARYDTSERQHFRGLGEKFRLSFFGGGGSLDGNIGSSGKGV